MRLIALSLCALMATPVVASGQELAPGVGGDVVAKACQNCHGLDVITSMRHDLDGWRGVISQMIGNGASMTDQEADQAATYLATSYGFAPPPAPADAAAAPAAPAPAAGGDMAPAAPAGQMPQPQ